MDNLERLHDRHRQIGDELDEGRSVVGEPVLQTDVGIMLAIVKRWAFGLLLIFDPMGVAETTRVLMIGIVVVRMLQRRLGECEYKARDDAEMKNLPHEILFYTGQTARERLKPAHEITRRAIATS